jgi:hypothetical protein
MKGALAIDYAPPACGLTWLELEKGTARACKVNPNTATVESKSIDDSADAKLSEGSSARARVASLGSLTPGQPGRIMGRGFDRWQALRFENQSRVRRSWD